MLKVLKITTFYDMPYKKNMQIFEYYFADTMKGTKSKK